MGCLPFKCTIPLHLTNACVCVCVCVWCGVVWCESLWSVCDWSRGKKNEPFQRSMGTTISACTGRYSYSPVLTIFGWHPQTPLSKLFKLTSLHRFAFFWGGGLWLPAVAVLVRRPPLSDLEFEQLMDAIERLHPVSCRICVPHRPPPPRHFLVMPLLSLSFLSTAFILVTHPLATAVIASGALAPLCIPAPPQ